MWVTRAHEARSPNAPGSGESLGRAEWIKMQLSFCKRKAWVGNILTISAVHLRELQAGPTFEHLRAKL